MYTLEDDQETSSRFNKRQFLVKGGLVVEELGEAVEPGPQMASQPKSGLFSLWQLSSSFKKLTQPGKARSGEQKMALAALTVACVAVFFTALDQTVVVTALPQIIGDLQVPITKLDHASWIVSAYLLGFIVVMPLMGRVSDIHGRRRIFLLCLLIFGLGSVLCGLAPLCGQIMDLGFLSNLGIDTSSPGLIWLIMARLFQAIGGGAVVPVAMAVVGDFYGNERRGLALGIIGAVTEAGGVLGPLYGALIVQHLGWQWIFYLNVPLVIVLMVLVWKFVPRGQQHREGIDWLGAALLAVALICLSLGLAQQGTSLGPTTDSSSAENNPIALAFAAIFLLAFVLVEGKVRWPVVELSLFKRFPFSATSLVSLLVGAALIIAMADIPIFVDTVMQAQVLDSGLALLRLTAMIPVGALLGGWLCNRITCRWTGVIGLLFTAAGFYLMSLWPANVGWTQITMSTVTAGMGFGLVIAPIGTTAINAVRARQAGMSSAVVTALRMLGMTLGLAALTSWALAYFKDLAKQYHSLPIDATAAQFTAWQNGYAQHLIRSAHTVYSAVFFATMVLCLIAIVPAFFLWGKRKTVAELEPEPEIMSVPGSPIQRVGAATGTLVAMPTLVEKLEVSRMKWWRDKKRCRLVMGVSSVGLVLLLVGIGLLTTWMLSPDDSSDDMAWPTVVSASGDTGTTVATGPHSIQLALDKGALTSIFVSQMNLQQGSLTDLTVAPLPDDTLALGLNLHVDLNGIHRVMPVEIDGAIKLDQQQNLQIHVKYLKRDGQDAGTDAAAQMERALNKMLMNTVMPALRAQLKNVKLTSVHTSAAVACSKGTEMLVLQLDSTQGDAVQASPLSFCFSGPIDLNKLLPH